jgi:hypothetical protein
VGEEATKRWFTVYVTGWLEDEEFSDSTNVEAADTEAAMDAGLAAVRAYWARTTDETIEVGDVAAYEGRYR